MVPVLQVENLKTTFYTEYGVVKAVDGVSFYVDEGEIIGLVGESGCGKSVSVLSTMQLIQPPGRIEGGQVLFKGENILKYDPKGEEMSSIRGGKIAMIFQEPMTSLNPVLTISRQLTEALEIHLDMDRESARQRAIDLLKMVGVPEAERRIDDYPHQFSGGMRQRVMIAMAMSCNPAVIIADEPTTAVDVTTQAQLLELMVDLVTRNHTALIIVTHNLGVVARYVRRIYVMYAGRIVESGPSDEIFERPRHPYTVGLLGSVPRLGEKRGTRKLVPIGGMPPDLIHMPPTCAFLPRCQFKIKKCYEEPWPALRQVGENHFTACFVDIGDKL
ncbi:MAG: ABC transporter ATP-binding protein [Dehalococcoidales bacterium]|nr:ABC transporter ATP-binding protein [Dehalococcoidales bacterium]